MPSRLITGAILLFWLGMTGWLIQREVVPMMLADAAPAYQIDLTEELEWTDENGGLRRGSIDVRWSVDLDGKRLEKAARSNVIANEDRTYDFRSFYYFDEKMIKIANWDVEQLDNSYRVTQDGKLVSVSATIGVNSGPRKRNKKRPDLADPEFLCGIKGEIRDATFEATVFFGALEHKLEKFPVTQQGSIVNPMHLVNRVRGLYEGKTWKIPRVDPFEGLRNKFGAGVLGQTAGPANLIAQVSVDSMVWDRKEVACYKIAYKAGEDVVASTWVRRVDGLVLKQEAELMGKSLVLQRIP